MYNEHGLAMGHTKTPSKIAAEIMALRHSENPRCRLMVVNQSCRRQALKSLGHLAKLYDRHHTLRDIVSIKLADELA